jgi:catechol 2,3-dioxygenase-like lactoylglutathione lyase family enzyme
MKFEHIALTINDPREVVHFYEEILGLRKEREFNLETDLAGKIFGIHQQTSVYQLRYKDLMMELFLMPSSPEPGFRHICLSFENREEILRKVREKGYETIRQERTWSDLVFIKDKSGNLFELKEERKSQSD